MKTIPEIVDIYNDNKIFMLAKNRPNFTYADLKKQINWAKNFFINQGIGQQILEISL